MDWIELITPVFDSIGWYVQCFTEGNMGGLLILISETFVGSFVAPGQVVPANHTYDVISFHHQPHSSLK